MAKYRKIADDLRGRIIAGEFPVGSQLPSINHLMDHYDAALNTVRDAQQILREEGLIRTAQGEGSFILKVPVPEPVDVVATLRTAQTALNLAIATLEQRQSN